jgi:hypothetical protein
MSRAANGIAGLKLPLIGPRRDVSEEERLLKLYWNRAELKKELSGLDDQLYQLRDRLKQEEGRTARVAEELESLETLLGNPELGFGALVHFQLRALWRTCHAQLDQFGTELKRQQEERERKRQLVEFHQDRQARLKLVDERLAEAAAAAEADGQERARLESALAAATGLFGYFRRRELTARLASQRARCAAADERLEDLKEARRTIEKEPWPEFPGLALDGRRAINLAVIAYAQLLYSRLAESGLALQARIARQKSVHDTRYGPRQECDAMMQDIANAMKLVKSQREDAHEIRARTEMLRAGATFRHSQDAVPDPASLPSAVPGRSGVSVREPNVLVDDYWDVYRVLLR